MDEAQVQARLQGLTINEQPNRKRKASTEDNEEVEGRMPFKRPNIDLDQLHSPLNAPRTYTLENSEIPGASIDSIKQGDEGKKADPVGETKKEGVGSVPDMNESVFSFEDVFSAARNAILTLESEEARRNPHWKKNIIDLQARLNKVARLAAPPKPAKPPKPDTARFAVELTVTDDSNKAVFQQTYKMADVRRLNGLYNVVRVQSQRRFEQQCGKNKKLTTSGGVLECEEGAIAGQTVTRIEMDGIAATGTYADWKQRNLRVGEDPAKIAMRLRMVEKVGLRDKKEAMDLGE